MTEKLGVMLCGHGSRDKDAVREFAVLSQHLKQRMVFNDAGAAGVRQGLGLQKGQQGVLVGLGQKQLEMALTVFVRVQQVVVAEFSR